MTAQPEPAAMPSQDAALRFQAAMREAMQVLGFSQAEFDGHLRDLGIAPPSVETSGVSAEHLKGVADYTTCRVQVAMRYALAVNGQWSCRRFGIAFGKEPVELAGADLGDGADLVLAKIIALVSDENISVSLVGADNSLRELGQDDLPELQTFFEAARAIVRRCKHCAGNLD